MARKRVGSIVGGVILILVGLWFILPWIAPGLADALALEFEWPLFMVGIGAAFLIAGLLGGVPQLAIPGCVVGGLGGIFYWQVLTDNFESWSYVWTLIPGFVAIGMLISGLLTGDRKALGGALWLLFISACLFFVMGSLVGELTILGMYWPLLLIALGLINLLRLLFKPRPASS
jgi:hypothetical protein